MTFEQQVKEVKKYIIAGGGATQFHMIKKYPNLLLTIEDGLLVVAKYSRGKFSYSNVTEDMLTEVMKEINMEKEQIEHAVKNLIGKKVKTALGTYTISKAKHWKEVNLTDINKSTTYLVRHVDAYIKSGNWTLA